MTSHIHANETRKYHNRMMPHLQCKPRRKLHSTNTYSACFGSNRTHWCACSAVLSAFHVLEASRSTSSQRYWDKLPTAGVGTAVRLFLAIYTVHPVILSFKVFRTATSCLIHSLLCVCDRRALALIDGKFAALPARLSLL